MKQRASRRESLPKVYLAGKIAKNDWRHEIFSDLRTAELHDGLPRFEIGMSSLIYAGPYFISCGHGCGHGEFSHGRGASQDGCFFKSEEMISHTRELVAKQCIRWLDRANYVFCWIDSLTCYGTLFELGYARATGKPIFLVMSESIVSSGLSEELWFIRSLAQKCVEVADPKEAWPTFLDWYKKRRYSMRPVSSSIPMSEPQRKYIDVLVGRMEGLKVMDSKVINALTITDATKMIEWFLAGGDPVEKYPEMFTWSVDTE